MSENDPTQLKQQYKKSKIGFRKWATAYYSSPPKIWPSVFQLLQMPRMTTIMLYNCAKLVLDDTEYFLQHLHLYTSSTGGDVFSQLDETKARGVADFIIHVSHKKTSREVQFGKQAGLGVGTPLSVHESGIFHPKSLGLLGFSATGRHLPEIWYSGVNLVTLEKRNCSMNWCHSMRWRLSCRSNMDL